MKITDSLARRLLPALALLSLVPLTGCKLFDKENDHILFIDYNKVGVATSGTASSAYESLLSVGWTGAKLAIVPATTDGKSRTPSLFATFEMGAAKGQFSMGNTLATGSAADKLTEKTSLIKTEGESAGVQAAANAQAAIAKSNADRAEADKAIRLNTQDAELEKLRSAKEIASADQERVARDHLAGALISKDGASAADSLKSIADSLKNNPAAAPAVK